jgi:adenosylcobalamin-dependent ribonucleoside-triphosphate reductase
MNTPNLPTISTRANVVTRRTYNRPLNAEGTIFETWEQTIGRVISHQQWLWERAKGADLSQDQVNELGELRQLMLDRVATVSGRTLWLGGTDVAKTREASQFNCSFEQVETVHDVVDAFWLLLQGCGVGFEPIVGTLNGFAQKTEIEIIRSKKVVGDPKGVEGNQERFYTEDGKTVCHITVGDSAEAWAKAIGKIMAMKTKVDALVIDFSEVRAAGIRLKGYGWISSGDATISIAFENICRIMNIRAGQLLTRIDIVDALNHLGTTLSSRRSAEIAMMPVTDPEADAFISAKKNFFNYFNEAGVEKSLFDFMLEDGPNEDADLKARAKDAGFHTRGHRQQSNNSILFYNTPSKWELHYIFDRMTDAGGSEPGFINAAAALKRAAWFKGGNPCFEILLGNHNFCNLCECDWGKLIGKGRNEIARILGLIARANYRQTCVDLDDGILQRTWHELNEFLRLCGVGATGIIKMLDYLDAADDQKDFLITARVSATQGAYSMADELGLPRPKAVTTIKPSGTLSKIMDTTEGVHRPLGRYIFNNITFSKHDPLVPVLTAAGYTVIEKPFEPDSVLATFPVAYEDVKFDVVDGKHVNLESAVKQLDRYKMVMDHYVDHNCSVTISYDPTEIPAIIEWLQANWDSYVGVSWIYRNDPTKTAKDLGYAYLPQEVVTEETFREYVAKLSPIDLEGSNSFDELTDADCASGSCPIR